MKTKTKAKVNKRFKIDVRLEGLHFADAKSADEARKVMQEKVEGILSEFDLLSDWGLTVTATQLPF